MNNIILKKNWQEDGLLELEITANSQFISASQTCYISEIDFENVAQKMKEYVTTPNEYCYLEFGNKQGNFSPAFSMNLLKPQSTGQTKIEMDIEINDNETRMHRCSFYVESDLGAIDRFSTKLLTLLTSNTNQEIKLYD